MPRNHEISTTFFPEVIADNALFALEYSGGLNYRRSGAPVSAAEKEKCITAITMLFVSFEGYFNRIIYLLVNDEDLNAQYLRLKDEKNTAARLRGLLDNTAISSKLADRFDESLVLRNAIAHGHLYETRRNIHRQFSTVNKIVLDANNGNYRTYVNENTYKTRNLRLHVIPSEVGISDLYRILKLWNAIYKRLNKIHGDKAWLQGYIFSDYTHYLQSNGRFNEIQSLENRLIGRDDGSLGELLRLFDQVDRHE